MPGYELLKMGLYEHLVDMLYSLAPQERSRCYWVMSEDWYDHLQELFGHETSNQGFVTLLGKNIRMDVAGMGFGFPKLKVMPEPPETGQVSISVVPHHTHKLDGREVAEALSKYLRTVR